jgi:hypothetical protein
MHYDTSFKPKMLTNKLQMLVTPYVSIEQKVKWFKQWNQPLVAREVTEFPKPYNFRCSMCKVVSKNYF